MSTQKETLVSVIVPVYNIAPYIEECLESICRQTYHNIEIIVVDDGSVDGSGKLCEELAERDERIRVIRQRNAGVAAARGRGIELSQGKYILFVDGDDWIEDDMIEVLASGLNDADLITSGVFYQETADKTTKRYDEFPEGVYREKAGMDLIFKTMIYDEYEEVIQRMSPWCYNKLYRNELVKEVYQTVDLDIAFAEDSVFLYKYLLRCRSVVIKHQCYYHYRYRESSVMHTVRNNMLMDINKVYLALEADFRSHELKESLLFQLQKWIMVMCFRALNSHMGFEKQTRIPEYIVNISDGKNKRLILYGAGKVGQDAYSQLRYFGYQPALWVDKKFQTYQKEGLPVVSPNEILHREYDAILIAVNEQDLAEKIKSELSESGIPADKQIWKKPMRIW